MYVYSKLANSLTFVEYEERNSPRAVNIPKSIVVINGGAGVANPVTMIVPDYVTTEIDKADFELLKKDKNFNDFVMQGMFLVSESALKPNEIRNKMSSFSDGCACYTEDSIKTRNTNTSIDTDFDIVSNKKSK